MTKVARPVWHFRLTKGQHFLLKLLCNATGTTYTKGNMLPPNVTKPNSEQCETMLGEIFRDFFDDDSLVLRPDMTARDVDGWDSLAHVRLLLNIERRFQIKFSAPEVGGLQSVGDLVSLIARKTNAG